MEIFMGFIFFIRQFGMTVQVLAYVGKFFM